MPPCLNVWVMQIDAVMDSEERQTQVQGGLIACLRCEQSNLRAIKRCGWPIALRCAF